MTALHALRLGFHSLSLLSLFQPGFLLCFLLYPFSYNFLKSKHTHTQQIVCKCSQKAAGKKNASVNNKSISGSAVVAHCTRPRSPSVFASPLLICCPSIRFSRSKDLRLEYSEMYCSRWRS